MKSIRNLMAAASLAVLFLASSAHAFGVSGVGGSGGILTPEGRDATGTFGMHLEMEEPGTQLHLVPGMMFWSSDGMTDVNPNVDLKYHFGHNEEITPYLGAGVGLHFRGNDTNDVGMNLLGGVRFPSNTATFFVEGRHTVSDLSQTGVIAGASFRLGR